jgi:hypothetical protein
MDANANRLKKHAMVLAGVFLWLVLWAGAAGAVEVLQNTSFENYDSVTLVPDNWQLIDGNVEVYADQAYDGLVSIYSLGGTYIDEVDTPNPPQSGTLAQLIDLSTLPGWGGDANWLSVSLSMFYLNRGGRISYIYLEYLPPQYNDTEITVDDAAWSGNDVRIANSCTGAGCIREWYQTTKTAQMPFVRWARLRIEFDVQYYGGQYFNGGSYYCAVDSVSADMEVIEPETPCENNRLSNAGFESVIGGIPTDWHVLSGRMTAISPGELPPYANDWYAGNIGGYVDPNPGGDPIDHPDPPQSGSLVQLIDLSALPDWSDANYVLFGFSGHYISNGINGNMRTTIEYLPASYNDAAVTWDHAAWSGDDVETALSMALEETGAEWDKFETDQSSMPGVRWVRVRLNMEDSSRRSDHSSGKYLGGFDQVCLSAESVAAGDLIQNASFEDHDEDYKPYHWYEDPDDGPLHLMSEPMNPPDGVFHLGKYVNEDDATGRVYQVIDLADRIPGWIGIDQRTGETFEYHFIQFFLSGRVANVGGTSVKVGLEYLPYSYNDVDGITWDDPAWNTRQWTSDGTAFTNTGGDAIDLGALIEDTTVSTDPIWREAAYEGWLPRVRWIRLRIELDAAVTSGPMALVGIDDLDFSAVCKLFGPYSGFGYMPEANFPEDPDAPDKPVPGWVGPEGDGISGGYASQTLRNYPNPAFAGFADDYANYSPSGQYIYMGYDECPQCITGRPYTDAGWSEAIITMGDMELDMLADYFGPAPSGDYHPGEITAVFNQSPIVNGPGHDFATFENGFVRGWTSTFIFGEVTYVEVSTNGTDFIRFPTHSLTPQWPGGYGCFMASGVFGITGKHVNAYGDAWGTPFDLDWIADHPLVLDGTVDLNDIRYVRQVDIPGGGPEDAQGEYTGLFYDSFGNVIFDSWVTWGSGGADLDAVAVLNSSAADSDSDHITDYWDNCPQTANEKQYDTDEDGYGNMCDCDIDMSGGDGIVGTADYFVFRLAYGSHGPERIPGEPGEDDQYLPPSENWNADADFNGDNTVGTEDYYIFRSRFGSSAPFN